MARIKYKTEVKNTAKFEYFNKGILVDTLEFDTIDEGYDYVVPGYDPKDITRNFTALVVNVVTPKVKRVWVQREEPQV